MEEYYLCSICNCICETPSNVKITECMSIGVCVDCKDDYEHDKERFIALHNRKYAPTGLDCAGNPYLDENGEPYDFNE